MLPFLNDLQEVQLITNDLLVAADSTFIPGIQVTVTGGKLRKNYYTLRGYAAEDYVKKIKLDLAFIGMDAADPSSGFYMDNDDEIPLIRQVINAADKVIVMCDSSKFSSKAFMMAAPFSDVDILITDNKIKDETYARLTKVIRKIILC